MNTFNLCRKLLFLIFAVCLTSCFLHAVVWHPSSVLQPFSSLFCSHFQALSLQSSSDTLKYFIIISASPLSSDSLRYFTNSAGSETASLSLDENVFSASFRKGMRSENLLDFGMWSFIWSERREIPTKAWKLGELFVVSSSPVWELWRLWICLFWM